MRENNDLGFTKTENRNYSSIVPTATILKGSAITLLVFVLGGCLSMMGYDYEQKYFSVGLDPDAPIARYVDGEVVHTRIGRQSAVELRIRTRESTFYEQGIVEAELYVENISESSRFDIGPEDVVYLELTSSPTAGGGYAMVYRAVEPDRYADFVASVTPDGGSGAQGGLSSYLMGATVGEAIIAANQARADQAQQRATNRDQVTTTQQELLRLNTLRPGEAVTGAIGFECICTSAVDDGGAFIVEGDDNHRVDLPESLTASSRSLFSGEEIQSDPIDALYKVPAQPWLRVDVEGEFFLTPQNPMQIAFAEDQPVPQKRPVILVRAGEDVHAFFLTTTLVGTK